MQSEVNASSNMMPSGSSNGKNKKKTILCASLGVLVMGLIIGAFFVGRATVKTDSSDNDNENIASELAFAQADLESAQARIESLEAELADATGQPAPAEKSLEEQLVIAVEEFGLQNMTVTNIEEIKNSPIPPFQTVTAFINGDRRGNALFWRNGTGGVWHFAWFGMGDGWQCTDSGFVGVGGILSKPFAGLRCFIDVNPTTVGEFFNLF